MKHSNPLVQFFSYLFIIIGSITLSLFYLTSWAHSLLFDSTYYLDVVTPLPKNEQVATALSTYTIDSLFANVNVEEKIRNALPEQAKFLSSTLATDLKNRSYNRTTQIIQSDQFSSV